MECSGPAKSTTPGPSKTTNFSPLKITNPSRDQEAAPGVSPAECNADPRPSGRRGHPSGNRIRLKRAALYQKEPPARECGRTGKRPESI